MAIDHSIYFRHQVPDLVGAVEKGMSMRDMIDKRSKEKAINEAYKSGVTTNPDGTTSFDDGKTMSELAGVDAREARKFGQESLAQKAAQKELDWKQQERNMDLIGRTLMSVKTPEQQIMAKQALAKQGIDVSDIPDDLSKNEFIAGKAFSYKDRIAQMNADRGYDQKDQEIAISREKLGIDRLKAQKETQASGMGGTFQKKKMETLGKNAAEWVSKDRNIFLGNLDKTETASQLINEALKTNEPLFGPVRGRVPDVFRGVTNEKALIVRDAMHSAIQDTMRPTLGAQFTEKEGERIMKLAINPTLSDEENRRRIDSLKQVIQTKIQATDDLYNYIEQNGTDQGFPYHKYGMRKAGTTTSTRPQSASTNYDKMSDAELQKLYNERVKKAARF